MSFCAVRARLPVGDGSCASCSTSVSIPADDHDRHPGGGAHQLRHQQVRVVRQPRAGGGARGDPAGGAEHQQRVRQHALHLRHRAGLLLRYVFKLKPIWIC
jgi:hypothetical protein